MITRRNLMGSFGSAVIGASGARAEQTGKAWRIGVIAPGPPNQPPHTLTARVWAALKARLRDLGYLEGQNLTIFLRWDEGSSATSLAHARELVGLGIDVLVTGTTSSTLAAASATRVVPIVMAASGGGDPVDLGFAKSLARPGGNITGLSLLTHALVAKRLELIKEAVPEALAWSCSHFPAPASTPKRMPGLRNGLGFNLRLISSKDPRISSLPSMPPHGRKAMQS